MFTSLIPTIFYTDLAVGLDLFVDGLGMQVLHESPDFVVVGRDTAKAYLALTDRISRDDRPELGLETDRIDEVFGDVSARRPDLLHPTYPPGGGILRREYGAREFALLDETTVCVVLRDWT
ncbi:MAG: hypothetical protein U0R80_15085 [Nocardioidaceae bacterium]